MSLSNNKEAEELSIVTEKRVTRSSKRAAASVESLPEKVSRKKIKKPTVGPARNTDDNPRASKTTKENKKRSNIESKTVSKTPSRKATKPRGKTVRGRDTANMGNGLTDIGKGTDDTGRGTTVTGRGKGVRGRGTGNTGRGKGVRGRGKSARGSPAQRRKGPLFFWSQEPPTAAQLAELGGKDGCQYVLSSKGRGRRGIWSYGNSRSWEAAALAVENLYDSD